MQWRLGSAERFETLLRVTIEMVGAVYTPPQRVFGTTDDEGGLVEIAFGLEHARTEAPIGLQPWLQGSSSDVLITSSKLYAGDWTHDLTDLSTADLEAGREH